MASTSPTPTISRSASYRPMSSMRHTCHPQPPLDASLHLASKTPHTLTTHDLGGHSLSFSSLAPLQSSPGRSTCGSFLRPLALFLCHSHAVSNVLTSLQQRSLCSDASTQVSVISNHPIPCCNRRLSPAACPTCSLCRLRSSARPGQQACRGPQCPTSSHWLYLIH